jgi:ribonuclease R
MRLAYYSPEHVGHFGLSLENYCHFTSPIRRYSDLIIQRLLFDEEDEEMPLEEIAKRCSDQERVSFRAESHVKILKKMRLLKQYHKEEPSRLYKAFVTRIKPFGIYFEVEEIGLEGFLHISELENDYFIYSEHSQTLKGRATGKTHAAGESIEVFVESIDLILLETTWRLKESRKKRSH